MPAAARARTAVLPATLVAVATVIALYSAWHSGRHMWRRLHSDYRTYSAYTDLQRRRSPLDAIPLPSDVFDFYAAHLRPGDRFYLDVKEGGYGIFDLPTIFAFAGQFYLLPAVEVPDVRDATVVVSYYRDPGLLHVHFLTQVEAGLQPIFVSRIRVP
jgi:hypothetical protein